MLFLFLFFWNDNYKIMFSKKDILFDSRNFAQKSWFLSAISAFGLLPIHW